MSEEVAPWTIGITDHLVPPAQIESSAFPEARFVFLTDWRTNPEALETWRKVDAILVWHWAVDRDTTAVLDSCKVVVRYGVGYDAIDIPALSARGIPFCNTPDYGTEEVADTACAMLMALVRKVPQYDRVCRSFQSGWQEHTLPPHRRTSTRTLGIVGVGRIGTAVMNRMRPFGFKLVGYDPYQPSGHEKAIGYHRVGSLEALLEQSDVVSIHCPLTPETRGMIDAAFLERMQPGSILVNTARGGIVRGLDDIEVALRTGRLNGVGFDVLPSEPPVAHPLISAWRADEPWVAGRLLINPHTGYYSEEGWVEMRYKAAETARLFLVEGKLRNHITIK